LAELMAAITLLDQISMGGPVYASLIDSIRAHPFDMQKTAFVYGSAEDLLGGLLQCQLNRRYRIPVVAKSLLTTAKEPDSHAGAEKASHTLAAALAGAQYFTNAGVLAVDEIYSPEQVIIDIEIVQYVRRVLTGLEFSEEAVGLDAIKEVGIGGNFLIHPTTLSRYRDALWNPALFEHSMLNNWKEKGATSLRDRAREIARKKIAQHMYELSGDIQRDLNEIWAHAQKTLC
jgi:trimethylamine--corrinoid protein Co-methyltransferase